MRCVSITYERDSKIVASDSERCLHMLRRVDGLYQEAGKRSGELCIISDELSNLLIFLGGRWCVTIYCIMVPRGGAWTSHALVRE